MNTIAITKSTIIKELSRIPDTSLMSVKNYLNAFIKDSQSSSPKNQNLKGIWKERGFERIDNIEHELNEIRCELKDSILQRRF